MPASGDTKQTPASGDTKLRASGDTKQATLLNRAVTWHQWGLEYEADPRHIEIIIEQLGLENAKPVSSPGTRDEGRRKRDEGRRERGGRRERDEGRRER